MISDSICTGRPYHVRFLGHAAVPEAEAPRRAEESQPTPAIDLAAPFVEMLDQLRRVSSELGKDDERGQEGYTVRFRDLDVDDRRRFSIELCQAGASHPECNRYKDILPYDEFRVPINGTQGYVSRIVGSLRSVLKMTPERSQVHQRLVCSWASSGCAHLSGRTGTQA